jgi:uncharacterized membrane protein (GlpM family)
MELVVLLALVLAVCVILFPAAFVWYVNSGGLYAAIKEGKLEVFKQIGRAMRIGLLLIVPIGIYALAVWFFFGHFGWQVALALSLVMPIVLLVPVLVWATVVSGLSQVVSDAVRRRVIIPRRKVVRTAEEPVLRKIA